MESIGECEYEKTQERKENEIQNLCITCKRDMGADNPRQLCGKFQCDYIEYMSEDEEIHKPNETISNEEMYNDMYYEIKAAFTPQFYIDAKIQFSDVCSNGDVYINEMLDELNLICNKNIVPDTTMKIEHYIEAIYDFYKEVYTQGGKPNPWWAD